MVELQRPVGTYVAVAGLLLFGTITSLLAKIGELHMFLTRCDLLSACCPPLACSTVLNHPSAIDALKESPICKCAMSLGYMHAKGSVLMCSL